MVFCRNAALPVATLSIKKASYGVDVRRSLPTNAAQRTPSQRQADRSGRDNGHNQKDQLTHAKPTSAPATAVVHLSQMAARDWRHGELFRRTSRVPLAQL